MGLRVGVSGAGIFAKLFIPLFQEHPLVDEVVIADLVPERVAEVAQTFGIKETYDSHETLCASGVDAIAIFSQRQLHGPQTLQALKAGKHVFCAVPIAQSMEEIAAIVGEVEASGLIYMTAETSYYYPSAIYCRDRFRKGDFGDFVFGEAQYLHDMSHGFYGAFQRSGGADWKRVAGIPPMHYVTHSTSMILSVTGAAVTHVSCLGFEDRDEDGIFRAGANLWDNPFSNETALMRTSDGGMCRINEFRRIGFGGRNGTYMSMFGTLGCFEENAISQVWTSKTYGHTEDLTKLLYCENKKELPVHLRNEHATLQHDFHTGYSQVHARDRLPDSYKWLGNGHMGSHQFLTDDFVKAVYHGKLPPNHVWDAAKYCAPGLVAHQSAMRNGEMLAVPDFGTAPSSWEPLNPYVHK